MTSTTSPQPVYHIVLFTLTPNLTQASIEEMVKDGQTLLSQIPGVLEVKLGLKAREERDVHIKNYDLALLVKLTKNDDLDLYGPHPKHQEFLDRNRSKFTKVQVIDFYGEL